MEFIKTAVAHFPNVEVDFFEGLTIDYCLKKEAQFILRGLRNHKVSNSRKRLHTPTELWLKN